MGAKMFLIKGLDKTQDWCCLQVRTAASCNAAIVESNLRRQALC